MERRRVLVPDILKGLAVIFMIQVHLTEQLAKADIYESLIGKLSLFMGGPIVAPVFLAVMGYFLAGSSKNLSRHLIRAIKILLLAFALNLMLNASLLVKIYNGDFNLNPFNFIFGVDILFTAGISILIIALLKQFFQSRFYLYFLLAITIAALSPLFIHLTDCCPYLLAHLGGNYSWSYFPIFPWLAYPLTGAAFYFFKTDYYTKKIEFNHKLLLMLLSLCLVIPFFSYGFNISANLSQYYHHGILFFGWTLAVMAFWIMLISFSEYVNQKNGILVFLSFAGKNVTALYVVQWIIIGNVASYVLKSFGYLELFFSFIGVTLVSSVLVYLFFKVRSKILKKQ